MGKWSSERRNMEKLKKRMLAIFTSIALVLGIISIPSVSVADDNPQLGIQIDGSAVEQVNGRYVSVFDVNGTTVTAVLDNTKLNGQRIVITNTSNEAVLSALNSAILGLEGYTSETMRIVLESRGDMFTCDLDRDSGNGHFSRSGGGEGGLLTTGEYHFNIIPKGNGSGGQRPNVQINMSSTADVEWQGQPAVREGYFNYTGDDIITWNYANDHSWKYCSVSVNDLSDTARLMREARLKQ